MPKHQYVTDGTCTAASVVYPIGTRPAAASYSRDMMRRIQKLLLAAAVGASLALCATPASAVLQNSTTIDRLTSAPTGSLSTAGWQYEGQWGEFLGTPIAPHYLITAAHVGGPSSLIW